MKGMGARSLRLAGALVTAWVMVGCATTPRSAMISFTPARGVEYGSDGLLEALNSGLSFRVPESDYAFYRRRNGVVGWVTVPGGDRAREVKRALRRSKELELRAVGYFAPEFRDRFVLGMVSDGGH